MALEIGSEFHKIPFEQGSGLIYPRSGSLLFSGRTAIETVLKDIPDAHSALLPSYCCDSIISPFRDLGIEVKFYNVEWDGGINYFIEDSADIFVWCNYFGYKNVMPDFEGVIIEDITHSFLSSEMYHHRSDYLVASLRKWEPIYCGGYCSVETNLNTPPDDFIEIKSSAMKLKAEYLKDLDIEKKTEFLSLFRDSNNWLAENYSKLSIDSWSREYLGHVNIKNQRIIRRQNAHILYEGLHKKVQFLFPEEDIDCPLFVPILLDNRDEVKKYLISHGIYCPVHWPKPEGCESNIYDLELSLICDQRYRIEDMRRIVSVINEII